MTSTETGTTPYRLNEAVIYAQRLSLGADEMYMYATLANEQLENILINRYGWVTVGGSLVWYQKF